MCLLAFAWDCHPRYRLVFAGNRDEFHARASAAADWWPDHPEIFGGRDLEAGGTWMALRRDGRFAVVTNFREPDRREPGERSRGELPLRFLAGNTAAQEYLGDLQDNSARYSGFNLIFGDTGKALHYFSNRGEGGTSVAPGVHALSNHLLDTPWPKVRRLRERFSSEVARDEPRTNALLDALADTQPAHDDELSYRGLDMARERLLSAAKIVDPVYGTRASTVILLARDGGWSFVERRYGPDGAITGETRHSEAR